MKADRPTSSVAHTSTRLAHTSTRLERASAVRARPVASAAPFHPNARGEAGVADSVVLP
jgi:hypothetical protein